MLSNNKENYIHQIEIVRAVPADLEIVLKLWLEAASWLESKGIQQWKTNSFTIESVIEQFKEIF